MRARERKIRGSESLPRGLKEKGRNRRTEIAALASRSAVPVRNDRMPKLELVQRKPQDLIAPKRNARKIEPAHVRDVMDSINRVGFVSPALIDEHGNILDGVVRVEAAKQLNLELMPCVLAEHLTPSEKRAVRLALNRLGEKGTWDLGELKSELLELLDDGITIEATGFTLPEFDMITIGDDVDAIEPGPLQPDEGGEPVAQINDIFVFDGRHRVLCGDATMPESYPLLMQGETARLVFTDEPYNVNIAGHVTKGEHREFVMARGEMSDSQFLTFNKSWIGAAILHLCEGGLLGTFIDWRGYPLVHTAATEASLTAINLVVWTKTNAGMGSLFRSQHELFPLYKKGKGPHVNNIELGRNGRWRSNVWNYPGASSLGSDSRKGLQLHPTVKPLALCRDAILDVTNRGDILLDPFMGSGSNLIAAEQTGRCCYGIELDPRFIDVLIKRYQAIFGTNAVLESTGETFDDVAARRRSENKE